MKHLILAIIFIFSCGALQAQNIIKPEYNNEGFYLSASLLGAAWTIDDLDIDTEAGGGIGFKIGYNFNPSWGIFAALDAAVIEPDEGDDYVLGHFDIGVQYTFRTPSDRFRPYAQASILGMSAQDDDFEINGGGIAVGAGGLIYLTNNLAFDIAYKHSFVDLEEVKIGTNTFDIDESATTGRFLLGLTYHF